ncbi:MAG: sugar phosphate nucleotidyltransferase [Proteobacteria bacterium]|nr:sugar phosphate nucleotidyltransferase [Pseudomonadota bacterium]
MKVQQLSSDITIYPHESVKVALKKLDKTARKVIIVIDENNKLLGTLSDGDVRRYILDNRSLDQSIQGVFNTVPVFVRDEDIFEKNIKNILINKKIELLPVINCDKKVSGYLTWDQVFELSNDTHNNYIGRELDIPVVIMAGGKGTRLEPFTNIFPKALIPFEGRTILEVIISEFRKHDIKNYYLTLNYKGAIIESYLNCLDKEYSVEYIREEKFLGTAGSLKLLENKIKGPFVVSNCDIIVKADYSDVLSFHNKHQASLTILSSIQHYKIPYGIVSFKEGGEVTEIVEKPEYTFTINTGVYIINDDVLKYIPSNKNFDMTDLISILLKNNKKVITYPVNENDYFDIGQWDEYKKSINKTELN